MYCSSILMRGYRICRPFCQRVAIVLAMGRAFLLRPLPNGLNCGRFIERCVRVSVWLRRSGRYSPSDGSGLSPESSQSLSRYMHSSLRGMKSSAPPARCRLRKTRPSGKYVRVLKLALGATFVQASLMSPPVCARGLRGSESMNWWLSTAPIACTYALGTFLRSALSGRIIASISCISKSVTSWTFETLRDSNLCVMADSSPSRPDQSRRLRGRTRSASLATPRRQVPTRAHPASDLGRPTGGPWLARRGRSTGKTFLR